MCSEERKSEKENNSYKNEQISNKRKNEKLNENMSDDLVIKKKGGTDTAGNPVQWDDQYE